MLNYQRVWILRIPSRLDYQNPSAIINQQGFRTLLKIWDKKITIWIHGLTMGQDMGRTKNRMLPSILLRVVYPAAAPKMLDATLD